MAVRRDTEKDVGSRARERDGWVPGRNGGWLRPISKGDRRVGYKKPHSLTETLQAARKASPRALATLIRHLDDPDGRVSVTAANLILERAWGRPKEHQPDEAEEPIKIDLSILTNEELAILARLVTSDRWNGLPSPTSNVDHTDAASVEGKVVEVELPDKK
jgi:hypothetical protein